MFNVDLVQVVILWCITGVGAVCALNARGFFRQVISWIIIITVATAAAIISYLKMESLKQEIGLSEAKANSSSSIVTDSIPSSSSVLLPAATTNDSAITFYNSAEKQLVENMTAVSDSILSFPKWKDIFSQGIEKREGFESKALSLRNRSMNSYRQIRNLIPPVEKKQSHDLLLSAADNLRLAGYEIHHQFGLEDSLGRSIDKAREYANQAKSAIYNATSKE